MRKPREIKSKLGAIRNSFTDKKTIVDDVYDRYARDIESFGQKQGKKLDDYLSKRKKKKESKKDIFGELIEIVENFISIDGSYRSNDKFAIRQKIKNYARQSLEITLLTTRETIQENVKKIFFAGEGICGANERIPQDSIIIKPKEIDFLNIFTIDPKSNMGQIVYEPSSPEIGKQKVNRRLYESFTGGQYNLLKNDGSSFFTSTWNVPNQEFQISGLKQNTILEVNDFFNDYFSTIEMPDLSAITKTAVMLTIQGDGSEPIQFKLSMNNLDRMLNKLFSVCGSKKNRENIKNQNPKDSFDENEEVVEDYFDFDNIDDIDYEKEDALLRNVLKFVDCENFEISINPDNIEDFVYLSTKKTLDDLVNETLEKTANDASEQSNGTISPDTFNISLINNFILNLPKALVMNVLSPKLFLPIVVIYKLFKTAANEIIDVKELMKKLSKLFFGIIKDLFWKFVRTFWSFIKSELLLFVRFIVSQILKNKYKRNVTILTALFQMLKDIKIGSIDNCENLFDSILKTIEKATSVKGSLNVPGILLSNSDGLPGLSKQKLLLDAVEFLESNNISTGDIFGQPNNVVKLVESMFDSMLKNIDEVSYIRGSNKSAVIPTQGGPVFIPQGIITFGGKLF